MTEKSPASSIHSVEPVAASYDGSDAGPAASNEQTDSSGRDAGDGQNADSTSPDAAGSQVDSLPAAESSAESCKQADGTDGVATEAASEVDKLKLSTLKEHTVVSRTQLIGLHVNVS